MPLKDRLKQIVPKNIWEPLSSCYWQWFNRDRHVLARILSPAWMKNKQNLQRWHNKYAGERCFIVGNGPSLKTTDLSKLKNEFTIGMNRIYLAFEEYDFITSCLVSVNDLVLEQCHQDIKDLTIPKFITWRARKYFNADENTLFLDTDYSLPENFNGNALGRLFEGFTVTFVCLQLAYYLGFSEVFLIGVDHNFITKGPANAVVTSEGDDPNHFTGNYFGKGFRWQLPDLAGSERAYHLANEAYNAVGRQILDATVGGKLRVFPKVNYNDLF